MTWQGGKIATGSATPPVAFARLRPIVTGPAVTGPNVTGSNIDLGASLKSASQALSDLGSQVHVHVQFVMDAAGEKVDHWDVGAGSPQPSVVQGRPKSADVHIVMRPDTWMQIASGRLAPYDALFGGKVRVGGDLEMAKRIVQHLSDPKVPYVAPC